jgi:glucose/arabinose dehydrogenase
MLISLRVLVTSFLFVVSLTAHSQQNYHIETLAEGLEFPWSLAFLPEGQVLITERPGRLRLLDADRKLHRVSGLPDIFAQGQSGLFEVLLAPDFATSKHLYLSYTCGTHNANTLCLARGILNKNALQHTQEIFAAQPLRKDVAHYGGRMVFLPDNTLVLTLGDGFDYREEAQNPRNHLGKILRLNADGSAPADNPFIDRKNTAPEIFSLGHRNVQGLVYDPQHNRILANEHGPKGGDEINWIRAGHNYGWPLVSHGIDYTGARVTPFTDLSGFEDPLFHWTPSIAPADMTLYQGELFPAWQGDLLVAALAAKAVYRVRLTDKGAEQVDILFADLNERIRAARTGPDGAIYLLTDSREGRLLKVTPRQ